MVDVKTDKTQWRVNAMPNQVLGVLIPRDNGQDQIVQSGNYCCSSIGMASKDENKNIAIEILTWLTLKPLEQTAILEATTPKTADVRPPTTHHENHPS